MTSNASVVRDKEEPSRLEYTQLLQKYHKRLTALVAVGQVKQYGLVLYDRAFIVIQIDALDNIDIQKLYVCYQEMLCAATKMRGYAVLQLYVRGFIHASPNYSLKPARVYY